MILLSLKMCQPVETASAGLKTALLLTFLLIQASGAPEERILSCKKTFQMAIFFCHGSLERARFSTNPNRTFQTVCKPGVSRVSPWLHFVRACQPGEKPAGRERDAARRGAPCEVEIRPV